MSQDVIAGTRPRTRHVSLSVAFVSTFVLFTLLEGTGFGAIDAAKTINFPSKAVKVIIPASAGGGLDKEARVFAPFLEKQLKAPVIIENVVGAQGMIAYNRFPTEKRDGYSLLFFSPSSAISFELTRAVKYVVKDFTPVAAITLKNFTLVHPGKWKTLSEFLSDARQRKVSIAGTGGSADIQGRLFEEALGVKFNWVTYDSGTEGITAVAGRHVDVVLTNPVPALPMIRAGKLHALAVFSPRPDPFLPGVPTFKELGRDDVVCVRVRGCYVAPPGTPKDVVAILEKAMERAIADPESAKVFENSGITIDFQSSIDLNKSIAEDYNLLGKYKEFIK